MFVDNSSSICSAHVSVDRLQYTEGRFGGCIFLISFPAPFPSVCACAGVLRHRTPHNVSPLLNLQIKVRYGDKTYDMLVNRASGTSGIERIKAFVSRRRALGVVASTAEAGGGGGGGSRRGCRNRKGRKRRPVAPTPDTSMICPRTIRLIHKGNRLVRLAAMFREGMGDVYLTLCMAVVV